MTELTHHQAKKAARGHVGDRIVRWLAQHGVSIYGSRLLRVRGRSTGTWRTTPVNPLTLDGERYLVAPRGNTQWVRNLRVAGRGELQLGRHVEAFTAVELPVAERPAVLRPYLRKWAFEVGAFFDGIDAKATPEELLRAAPRHPVFRITPVVGRGALAHEVRDAEFE